MEFVNPEGRIEMLTRADLGHLLGWMGCGKEVLLAVSGELYAAFSERIAALQILSSCGIGLSRTIPSKVLTPLSIPSLNLSCDATMKCSFSGDSI